MLVLTRKPGERVIVGDGIEVTVVSVRGDQVRLGLVAPRDVSIYRAELVDAVKSQNAAAARAATAMRGKESVRAPATPTGPAGKRGRAQAVRSGCR